MYKYLFGPVPSRRLGRSLGVDLVPLKVCSFNCVFCQAGLTTNGTVERREYVPVADVIDELDAWVKSGGTTDYITFSGSGEPTLHSGIGNVIAAIRERIDSKIAVLTNSSLLHISEVRDAISGADLIKASLSAWDNASFNALNRPYGGIGIVQIIDGLRKLRDEFSGTLWLEVFLVAGINDDEQSVKRIAEIVGSICPDQIHLNTVVRPPAERSAKPVSPKRLFEFTRFFDPPAEAIPQVTLAQYKDEVRDRPILKSDD